MLRFLILLTNLFLLTCSTAHAAPSFNCAKANTPVEKLICSDESLAALDSALSDEWRKTLPLYADSQRASLIKGQKTWLKLRSDVCKIDASNVDRADQVDCLGDVYRQRIDMLKQQEVAHRQVPQINFDSIIDATESLSGMYFKGPDGPHFDMAHPLTTCRELYTFSAGNWDYTADTIGIVSRSLAWSTCAFKLLSSLNTASFSTAQRQDLTRTLENVIQSIHDEAEFHDIYKVAFGNFTGLDRKEILAIIFSHDTGTLHFYRLYLGHYGTATGKLEIHPVYENFPFKIETAQ